MQTKSVHTVSSWMTNYADVENFIEQTEQEAH